MAKQAPERFNPVWLLRSLRASAEAHSPGNEAEGSTGKSKLTDSTTAASALGGSLDKLGNGGSDMTAASSESVQESRKTRFTFDVPLAGFERLRELLASTTVDLELEPDGDSVVAQQKSKSQSGVLTGFFCLSEFARQGFEDGGKGEPPSMNTKTDDRAVKAPVIVAKGQFNTELELQCQRCLSDYVHPISAEFCFVFAANEATANAMPDIFDPVLLDDEGSITLVDMLEDELLLLVPGFAKHDSESDCVFDRVPFTEHVAKQESLSAEGGMKRQSPFAVLKGALRGNTSSDASSAADNGSTDN